VASRKLPDGMQAMIGGSLQQMFPEAAYSAMAHPVMGIDPSMAFRGVHGETMKRVQELLTRGIMNGDPIRDVTQELSQAMDLTVDAAERIARTSVNAAYNDAHRMVMQANSDIFAGYRWDAVMDDRTSPLCISLHGSIWPLDATPPGPPAHWNCRSILTPIFQDPTVNRVLENDTIRVKRYGPGETERYGWIKAKESSQDWLRKQPSWVSQRITGSKLKNKLFRDGAIDIHDIVGPDLRIRSDREVLRRAWAAHPRNAAIGDAARAAGLRTPPSLDTIAKEDRALAGKQPFDQPSESGARAPAGKKVPPERVQKWKDELEATNYEASKVDEKLRLAREELTNAADSKARSAAQRKVETLDKDRVRLRNKKWRIQKRIKEAELADPPPPIEPPAPPPANSKVARWENEWKETRDELEAVRAKLAQARADNNATLVAELEQDQARLVNKRWRRWKRLPEDSKTRLLQGGKPTKPQPTVSKPVTVAEKRAAKFTTTVKDVEDINKQILELRGKATLDPVEVDKLKELTALRTKRMNELRRLKRADNALTIPDSTRLPKAGGAVEEKITVAAKKRLTLDDLPGMVPKDVDGLASKLAAADKHLTKATDDYWNAVREARQHGYGSHEYRMARFKIDRLDRIRKTAIKERRALLKQHSQAIMDARGDLLNKVTKPKFKRSYEDAVEYAKRELDALGLTPKKIRDMDGDDLLRLAAQSSGRSPDELSGVRKEIFDRVKKELQSLKEWDSEKEAAYRKFLNALDDRLVNNSSMAKIRYTREAERAWANRLTNTIGTTRNMNVRTHYHEFGHHIAYRDKDMEKRMYSWARARAEAAEAAGETAKEIYRGSGEVGWKDKFWDHYIGKDYHPWHGGDMPGEGLYNEVLSMGFQTFGDSVSLKRCLGKDPEHFYLTWATMRGY